MILGAFESFQRSLAFGKPIFQLFLLLIFSFFTHIYAYYIDMWLYRTDHLQFTCAV